MLQDEISPATSDRRDAEEGDRAVREAMPVRSRRRKDGGARLARRRAASRDGGGPATQVHLHLERLHGGIGALVGRRDRLLVCLGEVRATSGGYRLPQTD